MKKKFIAVLLLVCVLAGLLPAELSALAASQTVYVTANTLPVYKTYSTSSKVLGTMSYGESMTLLATNSSWAYVKNSAGATGYCKLSGIGTSNPNKYSEKIYINSSNVKVYKKPDTSSGVMMTLSKNASYTAVAKTSDNEWARLKNGSAYGYVQMKYISTSKVDDDAPSTPDLTSKTVYISANTLNAYKSASTSSKKLGALSQGQSVTVYAYNPDWAYIGLNGKYGFCLRSGLTRSSSATHPDGDLSSAVPATVTAESVKVYQSASTSSKSLGTLRKGAEVNLVKASQSWAYIELNGKYGYCALDALTRTSELNPGDSNDAGSGEVIGDKNPLGTATVIQATAPVYDSMSASSPKATLKLGETVSFYGYDSKWVLIGRSGVFGFVPRQYLSADSYAELKEEDSGAAVKELETALLALGYLDGAPSINYSSLTTAAVQRLQAACGMNATGEADLATLRVLYSGNAPDSPMLSLTLSSGAKNDNVNRLQTRLYALGYLSRASSIDGDYGATTAAAVRLFQSAAGITATGTADSATIRALYRADAPTLASGTNAADANSGSSSSSSSSSGNTTGMPSNLASTTSEYKPGMSNAQKLEHVIYVAQQQLGKRYVFGSAGTATFDCSGLTMYCFKQVGVSLRHSAYSEGYNDSYKKVSDKSSLRRGDLVFFNTVSDGDQCDHVGIYLGSYYFIHASSGAGKVIVSNLSSGYYSRVYSWGRRILET